MRNTPDATPAQRELYRRANYRRHRRLFETEREAQTFAEQQAISQGNEWMRALNLPAEIRIQAKRALERLKPYGATIDAAVDHYVKFLEQSRRSRTVKLHDRPPAIFTPKELAALLDAATQEVLPVLVIGAFAGLRQAEIFWLDWKEIDLARGFIEVTAMKSKTARRRLVKIEPNLRAWLTPMAKKSGLVWQWSEAYWRFKMTPIREAAKLETSADAADAAGDFARVGDRPGRAGEL
ncbi:MAG: hypothetical protein ACREIA_07715 [Opitutaceae bacterium]